MPRQLHAGLRKEHAARRYAPGAAAGFGFLPLFRRSDRQIDAGWHEHPGGSAAAWNGAQSIEREQHDEIERSGLAGFMSDFLAALGLFFAIEGIFLAAFPVSAKRAMATVLEMADGPLRIAGIVSALVGVLIVYFVRG